MILKNNKGKEKEVKVLLDVEKNKTKYIVYQDIDTGNIYASKYISNRLKKLGNREYEFLNKILEEIKE